MFRNACGTRQPLPPKRGSIPDDKGSFRQDRSPVCTLFIVRLLPNRRTGGEHAPPVHVIYRPSESVWINQGGHVYVTWPGKDKPDHQGLVSPVLLACGPSRIMRQSLSRSGPAWGD